MKNIMVCMGHIKFEAEAGKWICIKKAKVDENTEDIEVARALASIHDSMDRKIWEFLGKEIDLEHLNKLAYEITGAEYNEKKKVWALKGRKSEAQIAEALAKCNSPSISKRMELPDNKHAKEIAKSYLTRTVLDLLGVRMELDPKLVEKFMGAKIKDKK